MALAEAQARLNVTLRDLVTFFEEAGVVERSIALLISFIDKHLTVDFLTLCENYGRCMAFIDHDELISRILKAYNTLLEGYGIERKVLNRRIRALKEDKKADPDLVARLENNLVELDGKKALAIVTTGRLRAMNSIPLERFKDEKFDAVTFYRKSLEKPIVGRKR